MKLLIGFFAVVLFLLIIVGFSGCASYNGLVGKSQAVDTAWANVQTQYQRRSDLIPNLEAIVKGAADFEKSTLEEVTKARASASSIQINPSDPNQLKQYADAQGELSKSLGRLLVTVENYPNLKANSNFQQFQAQLEGTENRINVAREDFNNATQIYNTQGQRFPTILFARLMGFTVPRPYFQADAGAQNAPTVSFDFSNKPAPTTAH